MTELLAELTVAPRYGQVVIEAEGASDLPVPETGEEPAVATTQAILVATRGDFDGDVLIEVRRGEVTDGSLGVQVFAGELSFSTPSLVFGSSLGGQLATVDIGRIGWVPVTIYAQPTDAPSRVVALVG